MSAASQILLPVRVEPIQGESALGYALRLAERNGYERWHWLLPCDAAMGALWMGHLGKRDVQALCRLASADPDAIAKLGVFGRDKAEVELGGSLAAPNQFINRRWPKVCPACVSERGYLPWVWDLVLWTACPIHGCWLVDKCPGCGQRLSWNRAHVERCCDQAPLSTMQSSPAPEPLVNLMRVMARACRCDGPLPDPALDALVGHLDLNQLAYLVVWLGTARDWSPKKDRGLLARRPTFEVAAALGTAVAELLLDWPAKFHRLIDGARSVRSKTGHPSTKKDFLRLSNCFEKKLALPAYDFARLEFLAYVQRKHPWWRRVRDVEDVAAEPDAMIPQMQAMKASGLSRPALQHRLKTGEIQGKPFMWGSKRRWLVSQADLNRWIDQREGDAHTDRFLTRIEAGLALGINKILVPTLHAARLIESGSVDKHHRTLYSRQSIVSLLGRFDRLARSANAREVVATDLRLAFELTAITAGRFGRGVTTAEVTQAILEFGTNPVALDKTSVGLARYLFDGREIAALVKSHRINNGWISHIALRRMLGCGHDVARFLVQRGFVTAVPAPVTRGRSSGACRCAQRISKESADRFVDLHVLGSHLKHQFGLGSAAMNRLAERHSVTPVLRSISPSVEIWLRQDLTSLMKIERASRISANAEVEALQQSVISV